MKKLALFFCLLTSLSSITTAQQLEKLREISTIGFAYPEMNNDILIINRYGKTGKFNGRISDYLNAENQLISIEGSVNNSIIEDEAELTIFNQNLYIASIESNKLSIETYEIATGKQINKITSARAIPDILKNNNITTKSSPKYHFHSLFIDEKQKATIYLYIDKDGYALQWEMNNLESITFVTPCELPKIDFENNFWLYDPSLYKYSNTDWKLSGDHDGTYYYSHLFSRKNRDTKLLDSCVYFITGFDSKGKQTKSFILNANSSGKKSFINICQYDKALVSNLVRPACALLFDHQNEAMYTVAIASDRGQKSMIFILKKFDLDGNLIKESFVKPEFPFDWERLPIDVRMNHGVLCISASSSYPELLRYNFEYIIDTESGKMLSEWNNYDVQKMLEKEKFFEYPDKNYENLIHAIWKELASNSKLKVHDYQKDIIRAKDRYYVLFNNTPFSQKIYLYQYKF